MNAYENFMLWKKSQGGRKAEQKYNEAQRAKMNQDAIHNAINPLNMKNKNLNFPSSQLESSKIEMKPTIHPNHNKVIEKINSLQSKPIQSKIGHKLCPLPPKPSEQSQKKEENKIKPKIPYKPTTQSKIIGGIKSSSQSSHPPFPTYKAQVHSNSVKTQNEARVVPINGMNGKRTQECIQVDHPKGLPSNSPTHPVPSHSVHLHHPSSNNHPNTLSNDTTILTNTINSSNSTHVNDPSQVRGASPSFLKYRFHNSGASSSASNPVSSVPGGAVLPSRKLYTVNRNQWQSPNPSGKFKPTTSKLDDSKFQKSLTIQYDNSTYFALHSKSFYPDNFLQQTFKVRTHRIECVKVFVEILWFLQI